MKTSRLILLANLLRSFAVVCLVLSGSIAVRADILYVTTGNQSIVQVNSAGVVSPFATVPAGSYPSGLAFDSSGNLYVADQATSQISKITSSGTVSLFATLPALYYPTGLAIDVAGSIYTAAGGYPQTSKTTSDGTVTHFVNLGANAASLGAAIDAAGNLYVANHQIDQISKITPGGVVSLFATLPANSFPSGLAFDHSGNLYVSGYNSSQISKISPDGLTVSPFATLPANSFPTGLAFDGSSNLYAANSNQISKISPNGLTVTTFATGINSPLYIAVTDDAGHPLLPSAAMVDCATSLWSAEDNAVDSISGNTGTLLNGVTYAPGQVGRAFKFAGGGQVVSVPNSPSLSFTAHSPMSISLWVYRTGASGLMHIVGKRAGCGPFNYQMALNMGSGEGLVFNAGGFGNGAATGKDLPLNTWTHLIGTFDGAKFRFFINGELMATSAGSSALGGENGAPFTIGNSGGCAGFVGLIDEVEIFGCALSAAEAQSTYLAGRGGNAGPADPYSWGYGAYGQLGDGLAVNRATPGPVDLSGALAGKTVTAFGGSEYESLALTSDGRLFAWGFNGYGGLGDGTFVNRSTPVAVDMGGALAGKTVKAIAAGYFHTLALSANGQVFAWGFNEQGQLVDGSIVRRSTPQLVGGALAGKTVTAIAAGSYHCLALSSEGKVFAWGYNYFGQVGNGTSGTSGSTVSTPTAIGGALAGRTVIAISAGNYFSLALTSTGELFAWGYNGNGQLGDGTTIDRAVPVAVLTGALAGKTVTAIGAGGSHNIALTSEGKLFAWGSNDYGQLGDGTTIIRTAPVAVLMPAGKIVTAISAGGLHTLARTSDGKLFVWGSNTLGQLGDGTSVVARITPVEVTASGPLAGGSVTAIAAGGFHTLALVEVETRATEPPIITGGLPADGGIFGPGAAGVPGQVTRTVTGLGHPGCILSMTISDPRRPASTNNNRTLTTTINAAGTWSIDLTLDDCDPIIEIVQICDGIASPAVSRYVFVDGTPPRFTSGGPGDGVDFLSGGGGGTVTVVLNGGASDFGTLVPGGGVGYEWHLLNVACCGGSFTVLGGGGSSGTLINGGSGLSIGLAPGEYDFELIVTDTAGNTLTKRCHRSVHRPATLASGLPGDGGIFGAGSALLAGDPGTSGRVTRRLSGTGDPGCTINITVSDADHPQLIGNNMTYTTTVDAAGSWSFDLTLFDCDPIVQIIEVCDGVSGVAILQHVFVDGTPPVFIAGGPSDGISFSSGGTGGGTATIILDGSATDAGTFVPGGGVGYEWHLLGGGGAFTVLGGGGSGGTLINGGTGLSISLQPGEYDFEVIVTDAAGNKLRKRCHRSVHIPPAITSGMPDDGGIYGPGTPGSPGHVRRTITGTGHPGCTIQLTVTDARLPNDANNNRTLSTVIDATGHWSIDLDLDDCDPVVDVIEICDGAASPSIRRHIFVDGTPPFFLDGGGPGDGVDYVGGGGTGLIVLGGGAGDRTLVPGGGVGHQWFLIGGDGVTRTPVGDGTGTLRLAKGLGDYVIEEVVTDAAGNKLTKRCARRVIKRTCSVQIPDAVVYYNESVALTGQVSDTIAQPNQIVPNAPLGFTVNGVPVGNPAAYLATLKPGQYPIGATFPGNEEYQSGTASATLTVLRRPTAVTTGNVQVPYGTQVTLTGALSDVRLGGPLTGRPLGFKVNGQSVTNPFEASLPPGSYPIIVDYAGDSYYLPSTGTATLTILSTPGKITGGGSIDQSVRNFGFVVQTKVQGGTQSFTGNLEYQDKALGYNLKATVITGIAIAPDRVHGIFTGPATMNGVAGYTFVAWVEDWAEPGALKDKFRITISGPGVSYDSSTVATKGGLLDQGGNIQVHKPQ